MIFRQLIESSVVQQRPDEALVLVHPTSLHSYRWNIGYDSNQPKHRQDGARAKADALANAFARAITEFENAGKPIVVLRDPHTRFEDWQYSYPEIFARPSAKYKRMDNGADDIEKQANQVAKTFIRKGVKKVVVEASGMIQKEILGALTIPLKFCAIPDLK